MQSKTEVDREDFKRGMMQFAEANKGIVDLYEVKAQKIEGTDVCLITLPCKNDGKKLMILSFDIS